MSLVGQINALVSRIGAEFKSVRSEIAKGGKYWTVTSVVNTNAPSFSPVTAVSPPSAQLAYLGARASDLINVQGSGGYGNKWKNGGAATTSTAPWGTQFRVAKTRYVEFQVAPIGNDASVRLFVGGVEHQTVPMVFPSFQLNVFNTIRVDLGPEPRPSPVTIRLDLSANMLLGQVWVDQNATIAPVYERGMRYLFHGDSVTQGETQNTGGELGSYVGYMSRYLGSADIWNSGVRGTGPNTTSTNGGNFKTRATTDVANSAADVVVVAGFFNDRSAGRTPALVAADMATTVDTILAMSNKPLVIVTGSPDPTGGSNATEWATFDSAIQTAMQARGVAYVSQSTGQVTSGTGAVLAVQGPWIAAGAPSWMLGNDNLHPNDLGHQYIAARMWEAMSLILGQVGNQPVTRNNADTRYLPVANPTATGTLTAPQLKMTSGAASGRYLKTAGDGTGVWTPGPVIIDNASAYSASTIYATNIVFLEKDTGRMKISDGVTQWSALPYLNDPAANSYEQRNMFQTSSVDLTLTLPATPTSYLMRMYEVRAGAAITVTVPASVKLTTGLSYTLAVPSGKSGFLGLRYSVATQAWYLISATVEV